MPDTAITDKQRDFSQHQTVITDIQTVLSDPLLMQFKWIDLCCGRGQILSNIESKLDAELINKISFYAYDSNEDSISVIQEIARKLKFMEVKSKVAQIEDLRKHKDEISSYDYITLINAIHEINPFSVIDVLHECIQILSPTGKLYVFDMETIKPSEIAKISFRKIQIDQLLSLYFKILGLEKYKPQTSLWKYSSTQAWHLIICRNHISLSNEEMNARYLTRKCEVTELMKSILSEKLDFITKKLDSISDSNEQLTGEEKENETIAVYDYYALNRILRS